MKQLPIPALYPSQRLAGEVTGCVEWDDVQGCFVMRYSSTIVGRLRCEFQYGRHNFYNLVGITLFLPLTLLFLLLADLLRSEKHPSAFCIFPWGIRDVTPEMAGEILWSGFNGVHNYAGDILVLRRPFYRSGTYIPSENFKDMEESRKLEELLRVLSASDGAEWANICARWQTSLVEPMSQTA